MTNPEPKVSEKARELAEDLNGEGLLVGDSYGGLTSSRSKDKAAEKIQSSISELLEAGRDVTNLMVAQDFDLMNMTDAIMNLAAILSKWEPPK